MLSLVALPQNKKLKWANAYRFETEWNYNIANTIVVSPILQNVIPNIEI